MNNFDIKPSIEPHDNYQNAFLKLNEAVDALKKLTPAEIHQLLYDFFGIKTKEELIQAILQRFQNI